MTRAFVGIVLTLASFSIWAEGYICIVSGATGFKVDAQTKVWRIVNFSTSRKYLLRESKKGEGDAETGWVVLRIGEKEPSMFCNRVLARFDTFTCEGVALNAGANDQIGQYNFMFNKKTLRFLNSGLQGFISADAERTQTTPYLEKGECSPL